MQDLRAVTSAGVDNHGSSFRYLLLSLLSGVLETGVLTFGSLILGLATGMLFALTYQTGCLFRNPLGITLRGSATMLLSSLGLFVLLSHQVGNWLIVLHIVLLSGALQGARERFQPRHHPVSEVLKRFVRVVGFTAGILISPYLGYSLLPVVLITAMVTIIPVSLRGASRVLAQPAIPAQVLHMGAWAMFFHQLHYFCYAYVLLAVFLGVIPGMFGNAHTGSVLGAALLFALGWITYISGRTLLHGILKLSPLRAVVLGHLGVIVCLACIYFIRVFSVAATAWILGGLGGGSVYAVKELAGKRMTADSLEFWENAGHIAGVGCAGLLLVLFPRHIEYCFIMAGLSAFTTICFLKIRSRRTFLKYRTCWYPDP